MPQTVEGDTKSFTIDYTDWKNPERKAFDIDKFWWDWEYGVWSGKMADRELSFDEISGIKHFRLSVHSLWVLQHN